MYYSALLSALFFTTNKFNQCGILPFIFFRKHAEAQTEHAMRNGGMRNFDNPLYGPNSGAQTQTDANGVAVGTQAGHYDVPKSKKGKGIANHPPENHRHH